MYRTPLPGKPAPGGISAGVGGINPPSYQVIVTGGLGRRAGNSYVMIAAMGYVSKLGFPSICEPSSVDVASIAVGGPNSRAHTGWAMMGEPMSPIAPVPNSRQPRPLGGANAGSSGRSRPGPSHNFQSNVRGTGGVSFGRPIPCFQSSPA